MVQAKWRTWVESERDEFRNDPERAESVRYRDKRLRDGLIAHLEDLKFYAERLAPDQHKRVFTFDLIGPIIEGLAESGASVKDRSEWLENERVFKLLMDISSLCMEKAIALRTEKYRLSRQGYPGLTMPRKDQIEDLRFLYNRLL